MAFCAGTPLTLLHFVGQLAAVFSTIFLIKMANSNMHPLVLKNSQILLSICVRLPQKLLRGKLVCHVWDWASHQALVAAQRASKTLYFWMRKAVSQWVT